MKIVCRILAVWVVVGAVYCFPYRTYAAVPHLINYQGRLTDTSSAPLNGTYSLTFRIYDAETAGNLLWEEIHPSVLIQQGIFSILLGSVTDFNLAFDKEYFLEIKVGSEVMAPRQRITSVGYAIRAETAEMTEKVKISAGDSSAAYLSDKVKNSIIADNYQLQLSGDKTSPGNNKLYGTDSSGARGWHNQPPSKIDVFTSSGTWVRPQGVSKVWVKVWGAGGGGGAGSWGGGGGGGGGGAYAEGIVTVTQDVIVTVGRKGAHGTTEANGGDGGRSSFGEFVIADGGKGGRMNGGDGGAGVGGFSIAGDIKLSGSSGGSGEYTTGHGGGMGGAGGNSPMGGAGGAGSPAGQDRPQNPIAGTVPGGGGGGGFFLGAADGADGLVIICY